MAVGFDAARLELTGTPVAMVEGVMHAVNPPYNTDETGAGQFSVSENGTLAYAVGGIYPALDTEFVWVDRQGRSMPVPVAAGPYFHPSISPDGRRLAFHAVRERSREYFIWIHDIGRQTTTRLTLDGDNCCVVWSPDGRSIVHREVDGSTFHLVQMPADASAAPVRLTSGRFNLLPSSWAAGTNVLSYLSNVEGTTQVWVMPMSGDRKPMSFLQASVPATHAVLSHDGRWLAYVSEESGTQEVYVRPYPGPGEKIRVSTDGGHSPTWARSGLELYYQIGSLEKSRMMTVEFDDRSDLKVGKPRLLFEGPYLAIGLLRSYDVTPDGTRFLMQTRSTAAVPENPVSLAHVVVNWQEELKQRVPNALTSTRENR
jgi:hypothetical protein